MTGESVLEVEDFRIPLAGRSCFPRQDERMWATVLRKPESWMTQCGDRVEQCGRYHQRVIEKPHPFVLREGVGFYPLRAEAADSHQLIEFPAGVLMRVLNHVTWELLAVKVGRALQGVHALHRASNGMVRNQVGGRHQHPASRLEDAMRLLQHQSRIAEKVFDHLTAENPIETIAL